MVTYASGSIRFNGLGSDYNFDEMVDKLAAIESRQVKQLMQWQQDWKSRLDAIKAIRGELMNLQSTLKGLNSMSQFLAKSTTSSDAKVATAVADGTASNTAYQINVKRLATYSTWTKNAGWTDSNEVISEAGGSFTYSYKGTYRTINVPKGTTVEGFLKLINNDSKNPGVRAQTIQSVDGITFQLRGMDTGKDNTLVIRNTQGIKGMGAINSTPANYEDGENFASFTSLFTRDGLEAALNTSGEEKTFVYTVDGKRRTINVDGSDTIETLVGKINAETPNLARLVPQDDNDDQNTLFKFELRRENTVYTASYDEAWHNENTGPGPFEQLLGYYDDGASVNVPPKAFDDINAKILPDGASATEYKMTVRSNDGEAPNNQTYSFSVNKDTTLTGLANQIKAQLGSRVDVKVIESPTEAGKYSLQVNMVDKTHRVTVENGTLEDFSYVPPGAEGWDVVHGDNAQVRINGVPSEESGKWLEVSGNTLKAGEVIPGITFSLLKTGETNIAVQDDTEKMVENIQSFIDAVNSFRILVKAYTDYDESKTTVDLEYSESLFDMQKGGILQGNYGIQMVSSRLKDCVARTSTGFLPRVYDSSGYAISGDVFSSLSQIGITTNAQQSETAFGLLEINYLGDYGSKTLEDAIAENPKAVAELFALQGEGRSNSDHFFFDSSVAGITKAGTHNVSYKIDSDGNIYDATVNGQAASWDNDRHTITALDGTAKGLTISVVNYDQMGDYSGSVSIKEGKINEMLSLLEGTEGMLGTSGTLRNLEDNYQEIIDNIESKIKREDERLSKWENTMLLKFSRLETVLAKYNGLQSSLESQLAQLSTPSSK